MSSDNMRGSYKHCPQEGDAPDQVIELDNICCPQEGDAPEQVKPPEISKEDLEKRLGENFIACDQLELSKFDVEPTKFMIVKNAIDKNFLDNVKEYLFGKNGFNLPKPKFLLSVTGGAKKFTVSNDIIEAFKSALIKVAANTNALIVSGGLDVGVMSLVGDAVKEDLYGSNQKVLGIASWRRSKLQHRDSVEDIKDNVDKKDIKDKYIDDLRRKRTDLKPEFFNRDRKKENNLNPKHTCFIFVDNDHDGVLRGEMKFRAELENSMAKALDIPLILIALEGGIGTLETIVHMIRNKRPVLLIDKTGGCADLIQDLLKFIETKDSELIDDVIEGLINHEKYKPLVNTEEKRESTARYLKSISERDHEYINIFRITGDETKEDIEDQILDALTKVKSPHNDHIYKMRLALWWDRLDKAKEALPLLDPNKDDDLDELHRLLKQALIENKPKFMSLLMTKLSNRAKRWDRQFLTKEVLLALYNNESRNSKRPHHEPLNAYLLKHNLINNDDGNMTFKNIEDFLKLNFDTLDVKSFLPNDDNRRSEVNKPILNIFLWCILSNRIASAKLFWKLGSNQICNALMASKILKYFSNELKTTEDQELFKKLAYEFEQLATSVLNVFEKNTRDFVNDILVIRYLKFIKMDCLQLAVESECEEFVAHRVVQSALDKIWTGTEECDWRSDILSKYEKSLMHCQNENNETTQYIFGNSYLSAKKTNPVWRFFCKPRNKFVLHAISYIFFLFFFTLTMLLKKPFSNQSNDNEDANNSNNTNTTNSSNIENLRAFVIKESILLIWILTLLIDEIRQMLFFSNYAEYRWEMRLKKYWQQEWNIFDMIGCFIFIIGFILVCFEHEDILEWGRLLLSIDLAIWYIRALQLVFVSQSLGPKILMIKNMVLELAKFLIIIGVFVVAFGVLLQSILGPYEKSESSVLYGIIDKVYWPIYGEIGLLSNLYEQDCSKSSEKPCLNALTFTSSYISLMIYMVIASVLLINLLIAMFTTIFDKIQNKSDIVWKNQRFLFIVNYVDSPFLPPPFNMIAYVYTAILNRINNRAVVDNDIDEAEDVLKDIERHCAKNVLGEYDESVIEYSIKIKKEQTQIQSEITKHLQMKVKYTRLANSVKLNKLEEKTCYDSNRKSIIYIDV